MKKPEKKEEFDNGTTQVREAIGYNQALKDMDSYWKERIEGVFDKEGLDRLFTDEEICGINAIKKLLLEE